MCMTDVARIFTKTNIQIIRVLSGHRLHIREIAQRIKCSPAKVHAAVQMFREHDMISLSKRKNKVVLSLNKRNSLVKKVLAILEPTDDSEEKSSSEDVNRFDMISPLDFRYVRKKETQDLLVPYLSESAFVKYAARVEAALAHVLSQRKICPKKYAVEIERASRQITADEVYQEEDKIKHNIRALANAIRSRVSDEAKPYVHFTTTSYDILETANAARYKDFTNDVLIPQLIALEKTLVDKALNERNLVQVGRTHGQHASPVTFGYMLSCYVSRLGRRIVEIKKAGNNLRGKISGAVGSYNASSLFVSDVENFERDVLKRMGLKPSPTSTQVVEAEYMVDYLNAIISCFGVLADLADDMRHLQRSEINEIGEHFDAKQVGSSTMPQKRNPINFENVKSVWKVFMPQMTTMYMDQLSEHQRDLTNSASMRFVAELLGAFYVSVERMARTINRLVVDSENVSKNFEMNRGMIIAEPLYLLLASYGHADAHEVVRELTIESQKTRKSLMSLAKQHKDVKKYLAKFTEKQRAILDDPKKYIGVSSAKAKKICEFWKKELRI